METRFTCSNGMGKDTKIAQSINKTFDVAHCYDIRIELGESKFQSSKFEIASRLPNV